LRVHVHASADGSSWYRLRYPAQALSSENVHVLRPIDQHARAVRVEDAHPLGGSVVDIVYPDPPDVVVVSRPYTRTSFEILRAMQRAGSAVVVDIDDDLHALDPRHPMWPTTRPNWLRETELHLRHAEFSRQDIRDTRVVQVVDTGGFIADHPEGNWYYIPTALSDEGCHWTRKACDAADLVTVTTDALAERYGRHGRVMVLPNCVPDAYLNMEGDENDNVTLGWTGTATTHCGDLDVVGDAVARACDATGATFRAVGGAHTSRLLGVADDRAEFVDWCTLPDLGVNGYPQAVANLDVGIAPLVDSVFNQSKSRLKLIEYAALGVPFVASPRADYRKLQALGVGLYADTVDEWYAQLHRLLSDPVLRMEMAEQGRVAMEGWTYRARAQDWMSAWTLAAALRHQRKAAA